MAYTATLRKLAANLNATYENTIFSHAGNVGDSREKEVIDYLQKVFAHKYGFQSGEVFDINDANSGQVDVIMYDNLFSTVFTDGTDKIFAPIESTYGIISVKSKMGIGELDHAIHGIEKYNALVRPTIKRNTLQITPEFGITLGGALAGNRYSSQQNINCIFAFDTTIATNTLLTKVQQSGCIDLVVIPNKLVVIGRYRKEFGLSINGNNLENVAILTDSSVGLFVLLLQTYLSKNSLVQRDTNDLIIDLVNASEIVPIKLNES